MKTKSQHKQKRLDKYWVNLPIALGERVKAQSIEEFIPISQILRKAIIEYFDKLNS